MVLVETHVEHLTLLRLDVNFCIEFLEDAHEGLAGRAPRGREKDCQVLVRVLELIWGAVLRHVERLPILVRETCLLLNEMLPYQVLDTSWGCEQQLRIVIRLLRHFIDFLSLYFN